MKKLVVTFVLLGALLLGLCAEPHYGDPNQPYDQIPGTLITPHTPYLKPSANGKLKVLYILPYIHSREIVEFGERMDQNFTAVTVSDFHSWYDGYSEGQPPTTMKGKHAELTLKKLADERIAPDKKYDLIVIGSVSWKVIPEKYRNIILGYVRNGAGLLYVEPNTVKPHDGNKHLQSYKYAVLPESAQFIKLFRTNKFPKVGEKLTSSVPLNEINIIKVKDINGIRRKPGNGFSAINGRSEQAPLTITATEYGKGRILTIRYYGFELFKLSRSYISALLSRHEKPSMLMYDQAFALLTKCAMWLTGWESADISIRFVAEQSKKPLKRTVKSPSKYWSEFSNPVTFNRDVLKTGSMLFGKKNSVKGTVHYIIKDAGLNVLAEGKADAGGKAPFPVLPEGRYIVTAMLENEKGGKIDFISKAFCVIADTEITELSTEKDNYRVDETVKGMVKLKAPLKKGEKLEIRVVDTWNRIVAKLPVKINPANCKGTFSFSTDHAIAQLWDIFAEVSDSDGKITEKSVFITIPHNDFKDFFCFESFSPTKPSPYWGRGSQGWITMQKEGVNGTLATPGTSREQVVRSNAFVVSYPMHLCENSMVMHMENETQVKLDKTKANEGAHLGQFLQILREMREKGTIDHSKYKKYHIFDSKWVMSHYQREMYDLRRFASPLSVIGAEGTLVGEHKSKETSGFAPEETKMFQQWCKKEYNNDLSALNQEWNTQFKDWGEIKGILFDEALKTRQTARWVDFRFFMRSGIWTEIILEITKLLQKNNPVRTAYGAEFQNYDMTKMPGTNFGSIPFGIFCQEFGFLPLELMLSFCGDQGEYCIDGNASMWIDGINNPVGIARRTWINFFYGCTMQKVGMESWSGSLGGMNYMTADFSEPLPFFKNIMKEVNSLQKGVSRLVRNAIPFRAPVAILWNPRNHYISRLIPIQANGFSGGPWENLVAWGGAPDDAMVLTNTLRIRSTYITPQQISEPGFMRKYRALILPYNVGMSKKEAEAIKTFVKNGGLVIGTNTPAVRSEHGKKLKKPYLEEIFPNTKKMNLIKYGKGHALYLKNELNGYRNRANSGNFSGADVVAHALKDYANVTPYFSIKDKNGLEVHNVISRTFIDGDAKYLGIALARTKGKFTGKQEITIDLKKKYYIWEIRSKKYLGHLDRIHYTLDEMPYMFALLPTNPVKLEVNAPKVGKQGTILKADITMKTDGICDFDQVANITVSKDGIVLPYYTKNVLLKKGAAKIEIPISFSEAAGNYMIKAVDSATGIKDETAFRVIK